ncbi:MAG: transposase [Verrucomicrobia bacterium]|nr:transposase [Verrucomicrobiota bacterium]
MKKTYYLKPTLTLSILTNPAAPDKPGLRPHPNTPESRAVRGLVEAIAPSPPASPKALVIDLSTPLATPALPPRQPLPRLVLHPEKNSIKLGLDVHLEFIMAVVQRDHASPQAPRKWTPDQLIDQVQSWVAAGLVVYAVQESCGFGFTLHRRLVAAGAQSFLITPINLNGQRKTDKVDARALCVRLSRWVDGNRDELAPIRIPTEAEPRRRESARRRQFLAQEIRCLANRGHGQVAEYHHEKLPSRWWGPRIWKRLWTQLDPWMLGVLEKLREIILVMKAQVVALDAEICDWKRFFNRKGVGSYTGCCPSEHSSGGQRRVGSIDRMGNGRVRTLLVEAVWRFLKWQPGWKAAQNVKLKLAAGTALKKKTIVALARQLAVDLWRWRTGRCTMEQLGWEAAEAVLNPNPQP